MKRFTVKKEQKLVDFISEKLGISKKKSKRVIDTKNVLVNSRRVWIASFTLKEGDLVEIPDIEEKKDYKILYEDRYIIAVDKPPFVVTDREKGSLEDILRREISDSIKAIHRLDKETSGVLLFAKDYKTFEVFKKIWTANYVKKEYEAISRGKAQFKSKKISIRINGKEAFSFVRTLKVFNNYTHFLLNPVTGRKHQIRIHLSKIGHPIVGDKEYGNKFLQFEEEKKVKRHLLHARRLTVFHPFYKKPIKIESELHEDFKEFIEIASKNKV